MRQDDFGDRMKAYESEHETRLGRDGPIVARLDGRGFSKFTKGFDRPFDSGMTKAMQQVASALVENTHAKIGYTQSDEITLIYEANPDGQVFFDGRIQKLASVLASMATIEFAFACPYSDRVDRMRPHFDCRVFGVPSRTEASNALLWRVQDCRKNAVQSIAHANFSHKELHKKSQAEMVAMCMNVGIRMTDFPEQNMFGTYLQRVTKERDLTDEEWNRIPESRRPATRAVMRSAVESIPLRYFGDVKNREDVIFQGLDPVT